MIKDAQWAEDKEATECRQCAKQFSVSRRRVCSCLSEAWSGSVAECLVCWTQAQKGPGSNRSHDAVG